MRKASTWTLEQGTQRRPLLQTSSPLKPKIDRGLTLRLVQQTGARHDGANSHYEDAASQSFAQLLRQDRQYRAFRRHFSLLERCSSVLSLVISLVFSIISSANTA
jgi:hypothetical protein